jgi:heat shock protein HtpX
LTTSFTTRLRSWLLIAGLSGLLVAIGAVIGGSALYLFVAFVVVLNVAMYWFSDRIALKMSKARPVSEEEAPAYYEDVRELSARAGIPMPRLYVIPAEQPNAFATGRSPAHSAVAVTNGLLGQLPREQMRGVLAHELAHIRNRDVLVSTIAAVIAGAVSAIANFLQFSLIFGGGDDDESPLGFAGALATIIIAPLAAMLLQLGVSRQREYLADRTGAELLGDGRPLADALESIHAKVAVAPLAVNPATEALYIMNPLSGRGVTALFSTHPPVEERVRRLRAFEGAYTGRAAFAA